MKRLIVEIRDYCEFYVVAAILIFSVAMLSSGCNGTYEPLDENNEYHRPWNEDPYAAKVHWMDNYWMPEAEGERMIEWKRTHPATDWVDRIRR
jgi:hypothetical protein